MMMTEKMIALMINLLLGQITESSTKMRERLKNCNSDKDISMVLYTYMLRTQMFTFLIQNYNHHLKSKNIKRYLILSSNLQRTLQLHPC